MFELVLLEQELIIGAQILVELRRTLRRKIKLPAPRCDEIVEFLQEHAGTLVDSALPVAAEVDDEDARVLGEAIAGQAEVFVTGDGVIQRLTGIGPMRMLSPRGYWEYLRSRR